MPGIEKEIDPSFIGIDYGAKRAGTTVACYWQEDEIRFLQSDKKKDADHFLTDLINELQPARVFMDAPLSLPMIYRDPAHPHPDYHYRACDRAAGAMSPMFIGGLTARAISLTTAWKKAGIKVYEAYPAGLVKQLALQEHYKKNITDFTRDILRHIPISVTIEAKNWHQIDAFLAWCTGVRFLSDSHISLGAADEGIIVI